MKRMVFFAYGVACHLLFLGVYACLAGFVGNLILPRSIDAGGAMPAPAAAVIDALLLAVFAIQHSVMARPAFKQVWTRIVPQPIERSTYVLASCLATALLMWQWQPIGIVVWDVQNTVGRVVLWGLFAVGWLMVPAVSLMINHFDLFGTRQVWLYLRGQEYTSLPFRTPLLYRYVRHPLYVGWALAFWATPTMTAGHFLFAGVLTVYMALAALIEERDLVAYFGTQYEEYRRQVPRYVPRLTNSVQVDRSVLRDPSWWHWAATALLLAADLAGVRHALSAAMIVCSVIAAYYYARVRSIKAFPVQIRLAFFALLAMGTLPGMRWLHVVQLAGTSALVTVGYCLLGRLLSLLPWNRTQPLTWILGRDTLFSVPRSGGIFRLRDQSAEFQPASCSLRCRPALDTQPPPNHCTDEQPLVAN